MNMSTIVVAIFIAFGFTGWPIIGNYSKVNAGWMGSVVMISTALALGAMSYKDLCIETPGSKAIVLLSVAGLVNGLAVYFYSVKVADANVPTAAFIVTVSTLMVVAASVLNWAINGAVPNHSQFLGFGLAIAAIYFLGK